MEDLRVWVPKKAMTEVTDWFLTIHTNSYFISYRSDVLQTLKQKQKSRENRRIMHIGHIDNSCLPFAKVEMFGA